MYQKQKKKKKGRDFRQDKTKRTTFCVNTTTDDYCTIMRLTYLR